MCYGASGVQTNMSRNKDNAKLRGKPAIEPCWQESISVLCVSYKVFTEELAQTLTPGLLVTFSCHNENLAGSKVAYPETL